MGLAQSGVSQSLQMRVNLFHVGGSVGVTPRYLQQIRLFGLWACHLAQLAQAQAREGLSLSTKPGGLARPWGPGLWAETCCGPGQDCVFVGPPSEAPHRLDPGPNPQDHCSASPSLSQSTPGRAAPPHPGKNGQGEDPHQHRGHRPRGLGQVHHDGPPHLQMRGHRQANHREV